MTNQLKRFSTKQAGEESDSALQQNPLMRQIAKIAGDSIDREKFSSYSTLLNKYARKFESFNSLIAGSSRFSGSADKVLTRLHTISGSVVESLEDLQADIEHNGLTKMLSSIMTEWTECYHLAKMNLVYIENFQHGIADIKISAVQNTLVHLRQNLTTLTNSLDAYSGYFQYAQKQDDRNQGQKQDYTKLVESLKDEADALSLATYMDFQTNGGALSKNFMQGATLRICDRLVEIIRPYIDTDSKQIISENTKTYNLLHDISISSSAMWKIVGRLDTSKKFVDTVRRDLLTPLSNVIYMLQKM